ncbi:hypothetical protein QVD17_13785 [Tagetes erecta]|uniref:Uncharacterized protein n=1 Tax=Tagetes erecta TaxID=13708 RepID=A0AAD8L2L6_TARER|nr:hypothetical protein QVD17_13785 [Tagetes erecta]
MDSILRGMVDKASGCPFNQQDVQRCPFLRNINKPTNLSFASFHLPVPEHGARGPIFEDESNFDMAFKLFHGKDGIVPLSEGDADQTKPESVPKFNPLAANTATISLSAFGQGGPFSFGAFSEKWKMQKRESNSSKRESLHKGDTSTHEALGNEWLEKGNCPIAKSYRAVSKVVPLVASTLKLPPGVKLKCPPAVVAARAALARTALVKQLRPQSLPEKMLVIGMLGMAANIPLGIWREHTRKFSVSWFIAVHAAVPFIAMLRKSVLMPKTAMALTIAASILGQVIGSRAERFRLMRAQTQMMAQVVTVETISGHGSVDVDGLTKDQCRRDEPMVGKLSGSSVRYQSFSSSSPGVCY